MAEIRINDEQQLIEIILDSAIYKDFKENHITYKKKREQEAWNLINSNKGKFTEDLLNRIFDIVDLDKNNSRWFGPLLAKPNRNLIFESSIEKINKWINVILGSNNNLEKALNTCSSTLKIKGASKGLASLILYLSDPDKYNIWVNKTQQGLFVLNRISNLKDKNWGTNYLIFNESANKFKNKYSLNSREIDWILTFIASYVESFDDHFIMGEDIIESEEISISVDDEQDVEDVVGEPMELQVMRWSPTNEMGVVALFIEFRTELGFPIVEIIRTRFPDAAVFEKSSKGYIRRYIEFEFKSSGYKSHLKSKKKCDYVICWEHNWKDCPIKVIELKKEIPKILATKNQ